MPGESGAGLRGAGPGRGETDADRLSVDPPVGAHTLLDLLWQDADEAMVLVDSGHRLLRANPAASSSLARFRIGVGDELSGLTDEVRWPDGRSVNDGDMPMARALRGETV